MSSLYELFQELGGDYPLKGVRFLPEPQRSQELTKVLAVYVERGWLDEARETANLILESK